MHTVLFAIQILLAVVTVILIAAAVLHWLDSSDDDKE